MKQRTTETETENEDVQFKDNADICQQLMDRYAASAATQHRHLVATAAAMRSILTSESLPLTPAAYFAAAVSSLELETTLEATETSALLTFLSVAVALVPQKGIAESNASEAVRVLVAVVEREAVSGVASVKCAVKCLGVLLVSFCDLEDWNSVKLGFETLLKFSVDKRPKVRKCAQDWLKKVFKSFECTAVVIAASKLINSMFKEYMCSVTSLSTSGTVEGHKDHILSKPEHQEVLHMFNVLKLTVPYLSAKISSKILSELCKVMSAEFSPLTRHLFSVIEALYGRSKIEVASMETENIIASLASYASLRENKPTDTILSASTLLKGVLDKLCGPSWLKNVPVVCGSLAGLLTSEASTALHASCILKDLISQLTDKKSWLLDANPPSEVEVQDSEEVNAIKSICTIFETALSSCNEVPDEHILSVISFLFLRLGNMSYIFMETIVLKLAELMNNAPGDISSTSHLQHCIGSAVGAMGPEKILNLLPISLDADNFSCANIWLISILKDHVVQGSLGYYMEHIVPLAKSIQRASRKVKKSVIGEDLQAQAHALLGLLPAFCRYPSDTQQKLEPLAELLIALLKKDSYMLENISVALQILVNQNKSVLSSKNDSGESDTNKIKDSSLESRSVPSYSKKTANRNIKALASCSAGLLEVLMDLFINSQSDKRSYLKDAIGCLASVTDSCVTKALLISVLKRFSLVNGEGEFETVGTQIDDMNGKRQKDPSDFEKKLQRSLVMELASFFAEGASEDLVHLIYNYVRHTFQASDDEIGHQKAYYTLSKILKEHSWFCSSRWEELIDLLLSLKSPANVEVLRSRLACLHMLIVHTLKINLDEDNVKAFLILNEIILTLKDAREERRKAAYDVLLSIGSSVDGSSSVCSDEAYHKLISMILGYLSGSSPQIKSGAVSALSVLVYKDPGFCFAMPDVVSSLLSLLETKALEVIKAVLGFVKVLVSCAQATDIQTILSDLVSAVLPWSPVSRHHFRSKVTVILEIIIRKCGLAAVESVTPEKYRKFVKTVFESRHKKPDSNDVGSDEAPVTADSSAKGPHKRKHLETRTLHEDENSMEHRKRERENKHNFGSSEPRMPTDGGGFRSVKRAKRFDHGKPTKVRFSGNGKKSNRVISDRFAEGGKRKPEQRSMGKKDKKADTRPRSASKFSKHKKFGRKS